MLAPVQALIDDLSLMTRKVTMASTAAIRSVLVLTVAALLGLNLLAASPTASAGAPSGTSAPAADRASGTERLATCAWRRKRCFGAISLNTRTGQFGWANDKRRRAVAVGTAQRSCKTRSEDEGGYPGQCTRVGFARNECMATAIRIRNDAIVEWASGYAYHAETKSGVPGAKAKARAKVRGPGTVRVVFWLCTTRTR